MSLEKAKNGLNGVCVCRLLDWRPAKSTVTRFFTSSRSYPISPSRLILQTIMILHTDDADLGVSLLSPF